MNRYLFIAIAALGALGITSIVSPEAAGATLVVLFLSTLAVMIFTARDR